MLYVCRWGCLVVSDCRQRLHRRKVWGTGFFWCGGIWRWMFLPYVAWITLLAFVLTWAARNLENVLSLVSPRGCCMSFIEVRNVWKTYQTRWCHQTASLKVKQGEFVTIVGASGCGKILFCMLLGQEVPSRGKILCNGEALREEPDEKRGIVFSALFRCFHI